MKGKVYCLIMAGGSGTRFWPQSRQTKPKQYLNLFEKESLLQSTFRRFENFMDSKHIYIVSSQSQKKVLEEQTPEIPRENLIYEPVGKNTLPCIGLATIFVEKDDPESVMVVSPSDHLIRNEELFQDTILAGTKIAQETNGIVTIGINPSYPATGYGYIQIEKDITRKGKIKCFKINRFVEKPGPEIAKSYLDQGGFYWNSGLFIFKVSVFLDAMKKFAPSLYYDLRKIQAEIGRSSFEQTLDSVYRAMESMSVDYGIMEHAPNIYLVEGNFQWNDLGNWESVYLFSKKDENGNAGVGETVFLDSKNSYVFADDGLVALIDLDDVIVVRDGNATLVCRRDKAEEVKKIVRQLKANKKNQFI